MTDPPEVTFYAVYRPGAVDDPRVAALLTAIRDDIKATAKPEPGRAEPTAQVSLFVRSREQV